MDVVVSGRADENIHPWYTVRFVHDPMDNPLYAATQGCDELLASLPDQLVNANQLRNVAESYQAGKYNEYPFIELTRRNVVIVDIANECDAEHRAAKKRGRECL